MTITIGSVVEITGKVIKVRGNPTSLYATKTNKPVKVMVLGKAHLYTGTRTGGNYYPDDYEPAYLTNIKSHPVWMVMPLAGTRYRSLLQYLRSKYARRQHELHAPQRRD